MEAEAQARWAARAAAEAAIEAAIEAARCEYDRLRDLRAIRCSRVE